MTDSAGAERQRADLLLNSRNAQSHKSLIHLVIHFVKLLPWSVTMTEVLNLKEFQSHLKKLSKAVSQSRCHILMYKKQVVFVIIIMLLSNLFILRHVCPLKVVFLFILTAFLLHEDTFVFIFDVFLLVQLLLYWYILFGCVVNALLFARVFLRAINTYADTMNQKFLNNDDFEVQVSGSAHITGLSFVCLKHWFIWYSPHSSSPSLFCLVVE